MDLLWADLLNSDWRDYRGSGTREDRIGNDAWLAEFLARAGWGAGPLPAKAGRESLRRLRARLRRMADDLIAGRAASRGDITELNRLLAASPLVPKIEESRAGLSLVHDATGSPLSRTMAAIAASFASVLIQGDPKRVKICANPDCGWVIYDESRNRTRLWCDVKECGNLIKVRRFRARRRRKPPSK